MLLTKKQRNKEIDRKQYPYGGRGNYAKNSFPTKRLQMVNRVYVQTVWRYWQHRSQAMVANNSERERNLRRLRPYESASQL